MKLLLRLYFAFLVIAAAGGSGCLDLTPHVVPTDAGAEPVESGADPDAGPSACWNCLISPNEPGPGCAAEWAGCMAYPRCTTLVECMDEIGCFKLADRGALIECIGLCAPRIKLEGPTDIVITYLTPVTMCMRVGPCAPTCNGSEPPL